MAGTAERPRDRVRPGEPDETGDVWAYPGPHCDGSAECLSCPTFFCIRCRRWTPWCQGGDGNHPLWCAECWCERHSRSHVHPMLKLCRCGEADEPERKAA